MISDVKQDYNKRNKFYRLARINANKGYPDAYNLSVFQTPNANLL